MEASMPRNLSNSKSPRTRRAASRLDLGAFNGSSNPSDESADNSCSTLGRFEPRIVWRKPNDLKPAHRNPRSHTEKQIAQIAASIERFGFTNPVLVDAEDTILAGHGRVAAAKLLGLGDVPTIRLDHLTEAERRAYIIADNRLAELAGWDRGLLAVELQELSQIDLGFEIELTGFETAEIDLLIEELDADTMADVDQVQAWDPHFEPVTQPGDVWHLGAHRLACGDALALDVHQRLLNGEQARAVFIDPPFNVRIEGHVSGAGRIHHREFAMAAGEMSEQEYIGFLHQALSNLAGHCVDGAVIFACIDWRHLYELQTAVRRAELTMLNLCVWAKTNAGMGSFYRSQHELVMVLKKGSAPHRNNVELGRYGRYRTNVWRYEGATSIRPSRRAELELHPTVKPVALVADAIKDVTRRGDLVLDSFAGSGTTILAAERTSRRCYALEIDPGYVDVAVRRWQRLTGLEVTHADTGLAFDQVAASRTLDMPRVRRRRRPVEPWGQADER
jgi:DNA modification methylase